MWSYVFFVVAMSANSGTVQPVLPNEGVGGYPVLKICAQVVGTEQASIEWVYGGTWNEFVQKAGPVPAPGEMNCQCKKPPRGIRVSVSVPGTSVPQEFVLHRLEEQAYFTGVSSDATTFVTEGKFNVNAVTVVGWAY